MPDVTVTPTATLLCIAKTADQRGSITLELRLAAPVDLYIGIDDPNVTTSTGRLLRRGYGMTIENDVLSKPATKTVHAICAGTAVVRVHELAP